MDKEIKIFYGIMFVVVILLLSTVVLQLLTQEHYKVARYEVESFDSFSQKIYYDGGVIFINQFYFSIQNDFNLSKGDDITCMPYDWYEEDNKHLGNLSINAWSEAIT